MLTIIALILQLVIAAIAFVGGQRLSRTHPRYAVLFASIALVLMIAFPLMRVFPAVALKLLGPALTSLTEFTGLAMPAGLLFGLATPRLTRAGDRRAIYALVGIAGVCFVRAGWWMVSPNHGDLGPPKWRNDVCLQTTDSTCVAASLATLLKARGVETTEAEMAAMSYVVPGEGTTDSRAAWALERKLAAVGRDDLRVTYERMTLTELIAAKKPCMVPISWGFFTSHMVCVMEASENNIVLGDPLSGRRMLRPRDFVVDWKGMVLRVE